MKRLLTLLLLVFVFCLTGCSASQAAPSAQSADVISVETEINVESEASPSERIAEPISAEYENLAESEVALEQAQSVLSESSEREIEIEEETTDMIRLTVGNHTILAQLEDNASANELKELLKSGSITMSASNYGGFEKVCALGTSLTSSDVQTTTQAGDIMLYSSNQIVIFYGSNSWAYTKLAKVVDEDIPSLQNILSGSETEVVIELANE